MGDNRRHDDEDIQVGAYIQQRYQKENHQLSLGGAPTAEERQQGERLGEIRGTGLEYVLLRLAGHRLCVDGHSLLRGLQFTRQRAKLDKADEDGLELGESLPPVLFTVSTMAHKDT